MVGGGEDWKVRQGDLMAMHQTCIGMGALSEHAYVALDESVDDAWFCEDWMDTREAQALLAFQNHSVEDFAAEVRRQAGVGYFGLRLLGPLVRRSIEGKSQYHGKPRTPERRSYAERLDDIFGQGIGVHPR